MSSLVVQSALRNRLLGSLSEKDFAFLVPDLHPVELPFGVIVETVGERIDHVVFVETGIASRLVVGRNGELAESGHIGFEGMTGKQVILGGSTATNRIQMQVGGRGYSIPSPLLLEAMDESNDFQKLLTRYALTCELQAEYTLLSATNHTIVERLARWLLMYHDRVEGDDFPVTHELLGFMLNVRRSGVTNAIHILEGEHAIRTGRGSIHITDRDVLERMAGGSYGIPESYYEQMIPPMPLSELVLA